MKHNVCPGCSVGSMQWLFVLSIAGLLTCLNGIPIEVQAALLLPNGDEYRSFRSLEEGSLWNGEWSAIEETTIQPVTVMPLRVSGDGLHELMALCCDMVSGTRTLPMQEQHVDRYSRVLDRTFFLFELASHRTARLSAVEGLELGSTSPILPVSASPSSAMLFVPAVLGLLGAGLRERAPGARSECESDAQPDESSVVVSACIVLLSPDIVFINGIRGALDRVGCAVRFVPTVEEVLTLAEHRSPTMVLVDRRVSAWDMLRTHPALTHTPIMTLIPVGCQYSDEHGISDLERGADGIHDFRDGQRLFTAKVSAYLRRAGYAATGRAVFQVGAVHLDTDHHEVTIAGQQLPLSAKPFAILKTLMEAPSRVFTRSELVDRVWGPQFAIGEHTLDVHVHALRRQLDRDPDRRCRLVTIKGIGFKLKVMNTVTSSFKFEENQVDYPVAVNGNVEFRSSAVPRPRRESVNRRSPSPPLQTPALKRADSRRSAGISRRRPVVALIGGTALAG